MKIICVGRNYKEHAKELNNDIPDKPLLFMKPSTALLVNNKPFYYPGFTNNLHHEIEVVLRISKKGKFVEPEFANTYYDAIGLGIDFTARDLQDELKKKGQPWEIAKAFDHSAVMGKFVMKEKIKELNNIHFELQKNENIVQVGDTKDLIFSFDYLISYISRFFSLTIGDYIFTGTPAGVGPVAIGDTLVGYLEGEENFRCAVK